VQAHRPASEPRRAHPDPAGDTGRGQGALEPEFISYEENDQGVLSTCRDLQTGQTLRIQSRFLCGAEGARSQLLKQTGATLHGPKEEPATCYSITFSADLADVIAKCPAFMNFIIQPDRPLVQHCMVASLRIIRPFHQFQLIAIPTSDAPVLKDLYEVD
jgi:2,4-dichlorophenol 6-monooxygenase